MATLVKKVMSSLSNLVLINR